MLVMGWLVTGGVQVLKTFSSLCPFFSRCKGLGHSRQAQNRFPMNISGRMNAWLNIKMEAKSTTE